MTFIAPLIRLATGRRSRFRARGLVRAAAWQLQLSIALVLLGVTPEPTAVAAVTGPRGGTPYQLAYVNERGLLMLADADGAWQRPLVEAYECSDSIYWAATADRIVCHVYDSQVAPTPDQRIVVIDVVRGRIRETPWIDRFAWSPDGRHMAFRISRRDAWKPGTLYLANADGKILRRVGLIQDSFEWRPDGSALAYTAPSGGILLYEISRGTRQRLAGSTLEVNFWARQGKAIVIGGYLLVDLSTRRRYRMPSFDPSQSWLSPDGRRLLFADGSEHVRRLELFDFQTLRTTPIKGSTHTGLGDDEISVFTAAFSGDGQFVFWTDLVGRTADDERTAIYRARTDGSGLIRLSTVKGAWVTFSPDVRRMTIESSGLDEKRILDTSLLDGSNRRTIGRTISVPAWRPMSVR